MSHYKPYPAYKDSGVEWIGRVPEHWEVKRFKFAISTCRNGIWGDDPTGHDDTPCVRVADFDRSALRVNQEIPTLRAIPERDRASRLLRPGNLLLEKSGGGDSQPVGQVVLYDQAVEAVCSNFIARMELVHRADPSFWCYQFAGAYACGLNLRSVKQTSGIQNLDQEQYLDEMATCPPHAEQSAIAAALDRETARIDALIAKKTRFIELLKEKRQALITHAVTKGLAPNVKMKDSGVEWIGEVPEHWAVCKLNFRYSVELGKMLDQKRITGKHLVPYLRNQDVQWGDISADDLPLMDISPDEFDRYTVVNGDLLVCEGGDVGRAAIWRGAPIGYQKALHRLRPRGFDHTPFMYSLLIAAKTSGVFSESDSKSTISHLPAEAFRTYRFPFPPPAEQTAIADALYRKTACIDAVIAKVEHSITLLKERRSALITAAVTGQIDLREEAA